MPSKTSLTEWQSILLILLQSEGGCPPPVSMLHGDQCKQVAQYNREWLELAASIRNEGHRVDWCDWDSHWRMYA